MDLQFHENALYVGAHFVWHDVQSGRDFLVIHAAHQELQDLLLDLRQGLNELLRVLIAPHKTLGRRRVEPLSAKDLSQHLLEDVDANILQQVRGESELECVPRDHGVLDRRQGDDANPWVHLHDLSTDGQAGSIRKPDVHKGDVQLVPFGSGHAAGSVVGDDDLLRAQVPQRRENRVHEQSVGVDDQDADGGLLPPSSTGSRMTKALSSTMRLYPPPTSHYVPQHVELSGSYALIRAIGICSPARIATLVRLWLSSSIEVTTPSTTTPGGTWMTLN